MRYTNFYTWQQLYHLYQAPYEVIQRDKPYQMWVELEQPEPCHDEEILLMMCASGICGTDLRVYMGERPVPAGRIGHEGFAIITEVGSKAKEKGYRKGMYVVIDCNHPDAQKRDLHLDGVLGRFYRIPADFVMSIPQQRIIPINDYLSTERIAPATAALVEPMTVALHALDYLFHGTTKPREFYDHLPTTAASFSSDEVNRLQDKNIVITGAGSIAVFAACLARINHAKSVTLLNRDPIRLAHAVKVAKPDHFFVDDTDISTKLFQYFSDKGGIDYVLVASHGSAVAKATKYINPGGTILIVAGIGKRDMLQTDTEAIELYPIRHDDLEKDIVVSGKPLKIMGAHGTTEPLFHEVLSYLIQGAFEKYGMNPLDQVSHIASLEALPHVFAMATRENMIHNTHIGKILVDFRLTGKAIYTLDEYTSKFPQESEEFLTGKGIRAIEQYEARSIHKKNTFASIRAFMDTIIETLVEHYQAIKEKELDAKERKLLEKAFLVANDAYKQMNKRRFRPDGTRFIFHPLEMADYAIRHLAIIDPQVIAALLLHDVIEYTTLDVRYLQEQFGEIVAAITIDLAQNRTFETMPLAQVIDYLHNNAFVPFLQQMGCNEGEQSQKHTLINLAIKNEHYSRLISTPKHSLSPLLKVLDNYTNYAWVRDLPVSKIPRRSQEEIAMFKAYIARCSNTYALPQVLQEDAYDVVFRYERVSTK
jgi:threonine dehydrogenase-like Zn-dependent dehydrogenase